VRGVGVGLRGRGLVGALFGGHVIGSLKTGF